MDALPIAVTAASAAIAVAALVAAARMRSRARGAIAVAKEAVAELQARLERSESERVPATTILTSMQEGVLLFGPGGATRLANAAAERHLGVRPSSIDALLPLGLQRIVRRAADERAALVTEAETGAPTRVLRGSAIPTDDGSVVLVVRDVTETRRLDQVRRDFVANASHPDRLRPARPVAARIRERARRVGRARRDRP
jgi:signal transduction histidine kinase